MEKDQYSLDKGIIKEDTICDKPDSSLTRPLNHEQERIREWLKQVRFKKTVFGRVDEADVWKKIAELNTLYEAALSAERARYDALLAEHTGCAEYPYKDSTEHRKVGERAYP